MRGNGLSPKHPALSLMKFSAPKLWTKPQTTRSPEARMEPVRMNTPASASDCPTVGANCRGGVTTDAMGWLKCGAGWTLLAPGRASTLESVLNEECNTHTNTHEHTRFTQVRGPRVEVTPLLLPVSL